MAIYHKGLEYHEDTTQKHPITQEEMEFLRNLQKELNTQDHVSQANPRYWVIKGYEKIYNVDESDGAELYNENTCETISDNMNEIKQYIEKNILPEINDLDGIKRTIELVKDNIFGKDTIVISWKKDEQEEQLTLEDIDNVQNWLNEYGYDEFYMISYEIVDKIYPDTMFLTQKAAEEHLRANAHHYDEKAHTYAMTAWRSPEVEKLVKILQEVEW